MSTASSTSIPIGGVYGESANFIAQLGYMGVCIARVFAVIGTWFISLLNNALILFLLAGFIAGSFYWQNYHDQALEGAEYIQRCVVRPVWLDPIRPIYEILQKIYNPLICWWNAINWITFGIWREVVIPLLLSCDIKTVFTKIAIVITTLADEFVAEFIASGDFLEPWPVSGFDWGPGSNPFDITGPGLNSVKASWPGLPLQQRWTTPGTLCPKFVDLWTEWMDLYSCLCFDLSKFLMLQPLITLTISWPPLPALNPLGLIASAQMGDPQLWAGVGHVFNAAINLVQQIWRIATWVLLYLVFPLITNPNGPIPPPGSPGFPRPSFRVFSELICQGAGALVRSIENAAQRFTKCFVPFAFDFRFFFCLVDTTICVAIKLVAFLLNLLLNVDRLGIPPQSPNLIPTMAPTMAPTMMGATNAPTMAPTPPPYNAGDPVPVVQLSLWETQFRDDWMEIINLIAPVTIPGWSLSNLPNSGTSIAGMRRLSECLCLFLQRLICDPSEQCTDENQNPIQCECYGNPVPEGILNEFSLCCIVEAALILVTNILAVGMEFTYNVNSILALVLWYDQFVLDYIDIIFIDGVVGENGIIRCAGRLFRTIPEVGFCIEGLIVDQYYRVIMESIVFIFKFLTTALVTNLVFALAPCTLADLAPQPRYSCVMCNDKTAFPAGEPVPSLATPCFPRGWLLTPGRAKNDWERIWKPIVIRPENTDKQNFISGENCFCAIFNMIPIPRLPCTNCKPCGWTKQTGEDPDTYEYIECLESPFKTDGRTCEDGLAGPQAGQGIVRSAWGPSHTSRSRRRVDSIRESLREARITTADYVRAGNKADGGLGTDGTTVSRSPFALFQRLHENSRLRGHKPIERMMKREEINPFIAKKRKRMMDVFHASHDRVPPGAEPLRSWTKNYLKTAQTPGASYKDFLPPGVKHARRYDAHLVDHHLKGDVMWGRDPETGKLHKVDERVECDADGTMPGVQSPGCFDSCCFFKRILRAAVRILIQMGDFFDALFFGSEQDPMWQYFVGPESNLFLADFEVQFLGLLVEIVEIVQCLCNMIELIFPIPFLDLCCPIIALADLGADVVLTLVKGIKSLALDNACLNARTEQLTDSMGNPLTENSTGEPLPVFGLVGDICANGAVPYQVTQGVGLWECCLRIDYDAETNTCSGAGMNPTMGTDPSMGTKFQCRPERDNFSYFTKPVNEPGNNEYNPFPGGQGPQVEYCEPKMDNEPAESVLLCDCCREGQSQFECDIDRMSDQTIAVVVCLCDIIRAMFPIPGLDLCCAAEAILIALIEVIRFVIQLLVNLGTLNSTGKDYFKVTPPRIVISTDPDYMMLCPNPMSGDPCIDPNSEAGPITEIGLVVQLSVIFDTVFGTPGGRCATIRPGTGGYTGGEAMGGAVTCVCQILNWIIPARKYPSLAVGRCPGNVECLENCPVIDLCCWFRETGFFINGAIQFAVQFLATFWQDWILNEPRIVIDFMFCDEYGEWDPSVVNDSAVGGQTNVGGDFWGPNKNSQSELVTPSCGRLDPILSSLRNLLSDCPCTLFKFVDDLLALVFGGEPGCFCGSLGVFRTLPELAYLLIRRTIQFLRMFWSSDFWASPDGRAGTPLFKYDPNTFPNGVAPAGYENQSWARWFIWPIANQVCLVALSFLCIPDTILGALFGCTYTRRVIIAGVATWPFEALVVALELIEGIADTFAGSCNPTDDVPEPIPATDIDGTGGVNNTNTGSTEFVPATGGLGGVDSACMGGAIVGLFAFPLDLLIADGELPMGQSEYVDDVLLPQLPTCVSAGACPPLDLEHPLNGCFECRAWCARNAPQCKCEEGGQSPLLAAFFTPPLFYGIEWTSPATGYGFGNASTGFCTVTGREQVFPPARTFQATCDCATMTYESDLELSPFSVPPGTALGSCDIAATPQICSTPPASRNPADITANPQCVAGLIATVPEPVGVRRVSGLFMAVLRYMGCLITKFLGADAGKAMQALINFVSFLWQLGRKLLNFFAVLINFVISLFGGDNIFSLIGKFFDVIGAGVKIFDPLPIATGVASSARRRRRGSRGPFQWASNGTDFKVNFDELVKKTPHFRQMTPEQRNAYRHVLSTREYHHYQTYDDNAAMWAEPFLGYDTSDCTTDPVACLCRNMGSTMSKSGMCTWNNVTDSMENLKLDGTPVTPDDVLHTLGQDCSEGTSPCDILMNRCGDASWNELAGNPALLYMWAECVDLRVAGQEIHDIDERFPTNFFHSHSGFLDLIDNVRDSAARQGARWREESREHHRRQHAKQRARNAGGLTDREYDRRHMTRTLHSYVGEFGEPEFPELASVMVRLDLKLHHISTGRFRSKMMRGYHGFMSGDWQIPTYDAWLDLKYSIADLGNFVVTRQYREGIGGAMKAGLDATASMVEMTRRHSAHIVNHGLFGEGGWIQHNWNVLKKMNARASGREEPRTDFTSDSEILLRAIYDGPAMRWWNSGWKANTNPFKPFLNHMARVRRVQRDHPLKDGVSLDAIIEGTPNPWTSLKNAFWKRVKPNWNWRLPDDEGPHEDQWENLRSVVSVGVKGYEIVYPESVSDDIRKRFLIGPGANCPLIADSVALIVDTFDYCISEYTFNLPEPDCLMSEIQLINGTNVTVLVPRPDVGCARRRHHMNDPYHTTPRRPVTRLTRYLDRTARHRKGFLRSREREWHFRDNRTHMVWEKWNEDDPLSYVRPRIKHYPKPGDENRFANIHPHLWKRMMSFVVTGANIYSTIFAWIDRQLGLDMSQVLTQFLIDLRAWIENDTIDIEQCGGTPGVGLLYWLTFMARCEWPGNINCSNPCALGLKEALKKVGLISLIAFGGVSIIFPPILTILAGAGGLLLYLILIPAVAWHYSPQCWLITPSIPIPGLSVNLPIWPVPVGLPVLPECLLDDVKSVVDMLLGPCPFLANFEGLIPICMYNGNPCPTCPDRIDLANCVNVGIADGVTNLAYFLNWVSPGSVSFITNTFAKTCYGNGCLFDFFPFNVGYLVDIFADFENASDTQQCRQQWCFWATITSIALPIFVIVLFGSLFLAVFIALLDIIVCSVALAIASPLKAFVPGSTTAFTDTGPQPMYSVASGPGDIGMPINPFIVEQYRRHQDEEDEAERRDDERRARKRAAYRAAQGAGVREFIGEWVTPIFSSITARFTQPKQKSD